jgi:hypothetical protein
MSDNILRGAYNVTVRMTVIYHGMRCLVIVEMPVITGWVMSWWQTIHMMEGLQTIHPFITNDNGNFCRTTQIPHAPSWLQTPLSLPPQQTPGGLWNFGRPRFFVRPLFLLDGGIVHPSDISSCLICTARTESLGGVSRLSQSTSSSVNSSCLMCVLEPLRTTSRIPCLPPCRPFISGMNP